MLSTADPFHLANLTCTSCSLDVFEVHLGILTQVHDRAKAVVQALEALEILEHLNKLNGTEDVGVLRRDLNDNLQVLADVDTKHLLHARD